MTRKINFGSALIALSLFFLPWIDFQCSGKSVMTQSGVQTIYGGGSLSSEFENLSKNSGSESSGGKKDSMGAAPLIAGAFLATLLAFLLAIVAYRSPEKISALTVGVLSGIALLLIVIQMAIGFPIKNEMYESLGGKDQKESASDPVADTSGMLAAMNMNIKYTNFFYLQLLALGIPVGLLAVSWLEKGKKGA